MQTHSCKREKRGRGYEERETRWERFGPSFLRRARFDAGRRGASERRVSASGGVESWMGLGYLLRDCSGLGLPVPRFPVLEFARVGRRSDGAFDSRGKESEERRGGGGRGAGGGEGC